MTGQLLKVGELAKRTGLTVRTLHHYDEIGLLKPTGRSEAGYRLYGQADVARLHGIQALRHLGLALNDIATMLDGAETSPRQILARQLQALDERIQQATELRGRLDLLQGQLLAGSEPDMAAWLDSLALMTTYGKYFSANELKSIFGNWKALESEWEPLKAEVKALMDRGVPFDALEVQPLAHRWMRLMLRWMDGDFDLIDRWGEMFDKEPSAHGRDGAPPTAMIAYVRQAIDLRMGLLSRYLGMEELRRFRHVPDAEWRELGDLVRQMIEHGVAPGSPESRPAVERWLGLLDRLVDHQPGVRDKLLHAHDQEPLLRAATAMPAQVRAWLGASRAALVLDPHAA